PPLDWSFQIRTNSRDGSHLRKRLADRHIELELTEAAKELVARQGFDPVYGARPLKRYLQHELESKIGRALIAGEVHEGAVLQVDVVGGALTVAIENPVEAGVEAVGVGA